MDIEVDQVEPDRQVQQADSTIKSQDDEAIHEFNFPFKPYEIQLDLMRVAHKSYEDKKFALLESPTGTGKSLSLICSSLTWLREHQVKVKKELEDRGNALQAKIDTLRREEDETGDWIAAQTKQRDITWEMEDIKAKLDVINKVEQRNEARRHAKLHNIPLENYSALLNTNKPPTNNLNKSIDEGKNILGSQESQTNEDDGDIEKKIEVSEEDFVRPKIYFASRTHSQLSQFVNEVKKTKFADLNKGNPIKVAPLASRANLCVNMDVLRLKDPGAINEKCMEMQKETNKDKRCPYAKAKQVQMLKEDILSHVQDIEDIASRGKTLGSCAYYASRMAVPEAELVVLPYNNLLHHETRKASSLDLKDNIVILDEAHNILETICSIHSAPITGQQLLASHTILSRYYKKFRNRMSPKNATMVLNIVKCITGLIRFLNEPKEHLREHEQPKSVDLDQSLGADQTKTTSHVVTTAINDEIMIDVRKFIGAAKIEQFNVFKLIDYFHRSQLARKLLGFFRQDVSLDLSIELHGLPTKEEEEKVQKESERSESPCKKKRKTLTGQKQLMVNDKTPKLTKKQSEENTPQSELTNLEFLKLTNKNLNKNDLTMSSYPIYTLVEFLRSLTNSTHDGKILTNQVVGDFQSSWLKFVLLNPSSQFMQMAQEARSIVLAGGTMQPFDEFVDLLFGPLGITRDRLTLFSCGHVVGREQICVAALSHGPSGKPLELSFKTRSSLEIIDEIGLSIVGIAQATPGGMVCFLPSYDYEQFCFKRWTQRGYLRTIETKGKQVFREPRQTSHLKPILDEYSRTVEKGRAKGRGALLFCVVGGKMSEGINFNDDLGRCVVIIGLPYANIKSAELQQKISYYDRTCKPSQDLSRGASSNLMSAGKFYYENLCIKGVNQSIGRAIRHRNDYAAIVLLDRRYSCKSNIKNGLPAWLRQSIRDHEKFAPLIVELKSFFANKPR